MTDQDKPNDTVKLHAKSELEAAKQANEAQAEKRPMTERVDQAREKFVEVAGGVEKKVRVVGKSAEKAGQQVKQSASKASAAAKEKYGEAVEKVRYGYDRARKDMDHLVEDVNEYVRDNPGRSVLIAAGVGFLLGMLMRGGGRHD